MRRQTAPALVIFASSLLVLYWVALNISAIIPPTDFRAFWTAAKLARTGPYDTTAVVGVQTRIPGCSQCETLNLRNPPWVLPFVLPFAELDYRNAYAVALLANCVLLLGCAVIIWHLYGGDTSAIPILAALSFGPAIWLIRDGQISALPLLGVTLFCCAVRRNRYFIAGLTLLLVALKPHLFIPLLVVIVAWAICEKRLELLAGVSSAICAASAAALALDHHVFSQYLVFASTAAHHKQFYQSVGGWVEYVTGSRVLGLMPNLIGIAGALALWRKRPGHTLEQLVPAVLVISIATSYYGYVYDHVLLLLPLIALLESNFSTWTVISGGILNAIVWIHGIYGERMRLPETFPWWMALGWLIVCSPLLTAGFQLKRQRPLPAVT